MSEPDLASRGKHVRSIFADYQPAFGVPDELLDEAGNIRAHWQPMVTVWDHLGATELSQRLVEARRLLHEHGMTYAAREGSEEVRPWDVDVFPLVIAPEEWRELAAGVAQRARLLDAILRDVYRDGHLLTRRELPPELVYANPGFLRPCHGQRVPEDCFLHLYAADLARGADGRWQVVADWTDAPLGLGYALETRLVFSRMFPGMIRQCRVERLAPFFLSLQQTLRQLAPHHRENPRIVLLSAGSTSSQRFEDAYLARYLNFTLAEVGDLVVRDERVVLKTLAGLLPVDVLMRRLPDRSCDPLELQGDTSAGVPGLLQAVRAGNVTVVNALGSSLLETPALLPRLPALCQRVLHETLRLGSAETWWSGASADHQVFQSGDDSLVYGETFDARGSWALSSQPHPGKPAERLVEQLSHQPYAMYAQRIPPGSTAPVTLASQQVIPASIALRVFAVRSGHDYHVLPGGLARGLPRENGTGTPAHGPASKDVWVVSTSDVPNVSLLAPPDEPIRLRRGGAELPSRVADNMFWLGRYVERADAAARMLRTLAARLAAEAERSVALPLTPLLRTLVTEEQLSRDMLTPDGTEVSTEHEAALVLALLEPPGAQGGFVAGLAVLAATADRVRDRLSPETWGVLHRLHEDFHGAKTRQVDSLADLLTLFDHAKVRLAAFGGMAAESMTRSQGWRFLELGRRLERSLHTIVLVQNFLLGGVSQSAALQDMLLELGDSLMTYRSRYLAQLRLAPVLDLLLTDETNPRSVAFQLAAIAQHVTHLPLGDSDALLGHEQRLALNMLNSIRQVDLEMLEQAGQRGDRNPLERLLNRLLDQLPRLSDLVSHKYFVHAGSPRQLAERHLRERP